MPARKFRIAMSEKCFRFKPDALPSHAPHKPGVYEFVTFDAQKNPRVLFVGVTVTGSVHDCLSAHMDNSAAPTAKELFSVSPDIYFDYVAAADIDEVDELKDIAGAFIARHKPCFNTSPAPSSGKHADVEVEEM
ncbi:MAG: hypothetical protein AAB036_10085 [Elusimicrobiota bacterium]